MRILLDTNVMISAILFPNSVPAETVDIILLNHSLVICSYTVEEIAEVVERKFKHRQKAFNLFLNSLPFELIKTPLNIEPTNYPGIRDIKDLQILASAIKYKVDILITGDKDFAEIELERLEIVTPRQFLEKYHNL